MTTGRKKKKALDYFAAFPASVLLCSSGTQSCIFVGGGGRSQYQILNPKIPVILLNEVIYICVRNHSHCPLFGSSTPTPQYTFRGLLGSQLSLCILLARPQFPRLDLVLFMPHHQRPLASCHKRAKSLCAFSPLGQREQKQQLLPLTYQGNPARYCRRDYARILLVPVQTCHWSLPSI